MNIKYVVFESESEIYNACQIALTNRLYVPGWSIRSFLRSDRKEIKLIVLAYDGERPIALGIILEEKYYSHSRFMVFVRKQYRRNGIGLNIFKKSKEKYDKRLFFCRHNKASHCFFDKCDNQ